MPHMVPSQAWLTTQAELQQQYTSYKNNLQQLAERIGSVEQETEEHKYVILIRKSLEVPVDT